MAGIGGFVPPVIIEIQASAAGAIATFKEVNGQLTEMQAKAEATGTSLSNMQKGSALASTAFKVMGGAALAFGVLAVKSATDSQTAFARLNQSLKNVGDGSAATAEEMKKLSEANAKNGYDAAETAQALGTLVTATGNTKDATQLMSLAMNVARQQHLSLADAADQLAKATQGRLGAAFKENGISLDTNLPKQQAINKAFDELAIKTSGQNAAYLETFGGSISKLGAAAKNTADEVGNKLIPVIRDVADFLSRWGADIVTVIGVLGGIVLATKAFEIGQTALLAVNALMAASLAAQIANEQLLADQSLIAATAMGTMTEAEIAFLAVAPEATGAMAALSAVMDANPIGAMVVAVVALVAALTALYKLVNAFGPKESSTSFDGKTGHWVTAGKGGRSFVPDAIQPTPTAQTPVGGTPGLAGTGGSFDLSNYDVGPKVPTPVKNTSAAQLATQMKKDAATMAKDMTSWNKLYGEQAAAAKDYNTKYQAEVDAQQARDKASNDAYQQAKFVANRTFDKAQSDANLAYNDGVFVANRDYAQKNADLQRTYNEALASAQAAYDYTATQEAQKNADAVAKIYDDYNTKVADLNQAALDKQTTLIADAATKQAGIVAQSAALLTDEFSKATNVDAGKTFATFPSLAGLMGSLKDQLAGAKQLADDAAALAAQGYTQTFIQQVVSQGPQVGDQMAKAILNATPDTQKQLQDLYGQLQDTSQNGVTALANQMSTGTSLATKALTDQYAQVNVDLQQALADNQTALSTALTAEQATLNSQLAAQQTSYTDTMASAQQTLDDAIKSANQSYANGLADATQSHNNTLADLKTTLNNALSNAQYNLSTSLFDANKSLQDALVASMNTFNTQVDAIAATMAAKVAALQAQMNALMATMLGLGGGGGSGSLAPPAAPSPFTTTGANPQGGVGTAPYGPTISVTVNGTNLSDPNATASTVTNAIRLGVTNKLSGMAIM